MPRTIKVQVTETKSYVFEIVIPDNSTDSEPDWEQIALEHFEAMEGVAKTYIEDVDSVVAVLLDRGRQEQDPDDARDAMIERRRLDDLDRGTQRYHGLDRGDYD